jgi:hypothetical protein
VPAGGRSAAASAVSATPALLVVAGAALVIIGVFLPWVRATIPGHTFSESGFQIGNYGTLILGAFALARGLTMLRPRAVRMQLGTPVIGGVLILGFLALRWGALQDLLAQAEAADPAVQAALGVGLWIVVLGALLVIAGGVLAGRAGPRV